MNPVTAMTPETTRPRKRILPKNRTLPYRVLALLQFARFPWIARRMAEDGLSIELRFLTTPLRTALGLPNRERLFLYLAWLEARGLVRDVRPDHSGRVECRLPMVGEWNQWDFPGWALKNGSLPGGRPNPTYHRLTQEARSLLTERQTLAGELVAVLAISPEDHR